MTAKRFTKLSLRLIFFIGCLFLAVCLIPDRVYADGDELAKGDHASYTIQADIQQPGKGLIETEEGLQFFDLKEAGPVKNSFRNFDGKVYYFDRDGLAVAGFFRHPESKKLYYFDKENFQLLVDRWITEEGNTYYFSEEGTAVAGFYLNPRDNKLYHFDPKTNRQTISSWLDHEGKKYYFDSKGQAVKGLYRDPEAKKLYYFNDDHTMASDRWVEDIGQKYYFGPEGWAVSGLFRDPKEGKLYYFDEETFRMTRDSLKTVDGVSYRFSKNGNAFTGLYADRSDHNIYYFDPKTGRMATNAWIDQDADRYYFGPDGRAVKGVFEDPETGTSYYLDPVSCKLVRDSHVRIDDSDYQVDEQGVIDLSNPVSYLWPTDSTKVSSPFGYRIHPIFHDLRFHEGIDIPGDYGSDIYAAASGTVQSAGYDSGLGNFVVIIHQDGKLTTYGHMAQLAVSAGDSVERGEVIGYMGSTGNSTGSHLHFQVEDETGNLFDPLHFLDQPDQ